jgi:hypothetical protein
MEKLVKGLRCSEDVRCVVLFDVLAYGENQKFQAPAVVHIHNLWVVLS